MRPTTGSKCNSRRGWLVQNCDLRDNYPRILIQSGPGTLRGCTVTRSGSGVEIGYDMPYVEGGCPCGIAIQDNHFIDVNPSSSQSGVIAAHTCTFTQRNVARIENVSVSGNEFDKPLEAAVDLKCVTHTVISGNRIVEPVNTRRPCPASPTSAHLSR